MCRDEWGVGALSPNYEGFGGGNHTDGCAGPSKSRIYTTPLAVTNTDVQFDYHGNSPG